MFVSIRSPLEEEHASMYRTMMDVGVVLEHKDLVKRCGKIRTIRFTVIPYVGATQTLTDLLDQEDPEKDIILDVDLDGFGTTSPGAMAMHEAIPSYEDLMRIYHTVHDLCDMDPNYWQQVKANVEPKCNYERGLHHGPPFRPDVPNIRISGKTKRRIRSLHHDENMEQDTRDMLEEMLEIYSSSITETLKGKFTEKMDAFLTQPFHVDESTIEPIIDYWHQVFKAVFVGNRVPTVIHVVRSPFYTPHHHLDSIECKALDALVDSFGPGAGVFHSKEVDLNRSGCGNKFPPKLQHDVGEHEHVEHAPWEHDIHDVFYRWDENEDGENLEEKA